MRIPTWRFAFAAVVPLTGLLATASAQQVRTVRLDHPIAMSSEDFSEITGLFELSPGHVMVADASDRRLVVLSLPGTKVEPISRIGAGPREFRSVSTLLARPGGGAYVVDFAQRRMLPVGADGILFDVIGYPVGQSLVHAADTQGRIYGTAMIFNSQGDLSDSERVTRWDPVRGHMDTMMTLFTGRSAMVTRSGQSYRPYAASAVWNVLPDGTLAVLDAATYRLTLWKDGRLVQTSNISWQPAPVIAADKEAFMTSWKTQKIKSLGQSSGSAPSDVRQERVLFPATYPAFERDTPLWVAPDGTLWIQRLGSPLDSQVSYDVIGRDGNLRARVAIAKGSLVAGFGQGAVYLARKNTDDAIQIVRYAYPVFGTPR